MAAGQAIDKHDGINTANFYVELGTAQFGVWGSFAMWVGLSVFALLKLCRYHQLENIRVSMYRERQRLINDNSADSSPASSLPRDQIANIRADVVADVVAEAAAQGITLIIT